MSFAKWYPAQEDTLRNVVPLQKYIEKELFQPASPFFTDTKVLKLLRSIVLFLGRVLVFSVRKEIWIENSDRELQVFSKPVRNLLSRLLVNGTIENWECGFSRSYFHCNLMGGSLNTLDTLSKRIASFNAISGHGSSESINTALIIAHAELIERISASEWKDADLVQHSISSLKERNIAYAAPAYIRDLNLEEQNKKIGWTYGKDLHTQKKLLLPASMMYIFYGKFYEESMFIDATSNGVGAYTNKNKALLGAFCELFERDSLLIYWLLALSPQKIDLTTFNDDEIRERVSQFTKSGCSLHLLDCKTEYNIPALVLVIIDSVTGAIDVQAAAGFDVEESVKKMFRDASHSAGLNGAHESTLEYSEIKTMHERSVLWSSGQMRKEIDFFIAGKIISASEYKSQFFFPQSIEDQITFIKKTFAKQNTKAYYHEFNHPLASQNGLFVVRAIVPDLIPIYFEESKKHINVERLYTFSQKMGFSDTLVTADDLNKIPHPFI